MVCWVDGKDKAILGFIARIVVIANGHEERDERIG
jgi:hypothetical protein